MSAPPDEFEWIASMRPLTRGDARALDLMDDAAVLPARPGFDLVISKDAMVEGVHVLAGEAPDVIARRLLRTSLSDLAAKAAEPFGYFLMVAWPSACDEAYRRAFADGLARDGERFGVALLGGDTVSTPGPLTMSATVMGWTPAGRTVLRSGASPGDLLVVCGSIGDGWLGLQAALGRVGDAEGALANHYRLPSPLFVLRNALLAHAHAAADISDGLLADVEHIAAASGLGATIELGAMTLSRGAEAWRAGQADRAEALLTLATGGDDYAIVCAIAPDDEEAFFSTVTAVGVRAGKVGSFRPGSGLVVSVDGRTVSASRLGWRH